MEQIIYVDPKKPKMIRFVGNIIEKFLGVITKKFSNKQLKKNSLDWPSGMKFL